MNSSTTSLNTLVIKQTNRQNLRLEGEWKKSNYDQYSWTKEDSKIKIKE